MLVKLVVSAVCLLVAVAASSEASHSPADPGTPPAGGTEPAYTLVFLKTGPKSGQLPKEENDRAFEGHFSNMMRMAAAGQLVMAGPFGRQRHDTALRGIFVLATSDRAQAEEWASTDPPTQAGVFVLEYHDFATDAPLRAAREADMTWRAEQEALGRAPAPGENARGYVLLTAEDGQRARTTLAPLLGRAGGVCLVGSLDRTGLLALLDAETLDAARERFAAVLEAVGPHELDEWYAARQLARLDELR